MSPGATRSPKARSGTTPSDTSRSGTAIWWTTLLGLGTATLALLIGPGRDAVWESPFALFVIVTIAASLCVIGSAGLLWAAHHRDLAEAGMLGGGLMLVSILPLVHGLTAPGVLYGPNAAVMTSVYVALPMALAAMAPLTVSSTRAGSWAPFVAIGRHWRAWVGFWVCAGFVLAAVLLAWPNIVIAPGPGHPVTWIVSMVGLFGALWLSRVQLRLYAIGERRSTLVASLAFILLGLTSLVWVAGVAFGAGWWAIHALDILGVLAGIGGVLASHRLRRPVVEALAPITALDPLRALELGLSPVVHDFVAALDAKDPITRDHVVRTAELAIRVGDAMGLGPRDLRLLGIGALLHDVGKLRTPDHVLNKPGRLTDAEFALIQRHAIEGDELMRSVPSLASAAPIVRSHHERIDATGYPDRLPGPAIPFAARIVAACDGYDAMAHTRQYREGMGPDLARSVLREHAGSQWDAHVVDVVIATTLQHQDDPPVLDHIGHHELACGCSDALPDDVRALISAAGSIA